VNEQEIEERFDRIEKAIKRLIGILPLTPYILDSTDAAAIIRILRGEEFAVNEEREG